MRKLKNRLLTSLLIVSLLVSAIPFNAFASKVSTFETYVSKELGVTLERIVDGNKVTVNVKSPDGTLIHTLMDYNEKTYLDGAVISGSNNSKKIGFDVEELKADLKTASASSSISWGSWQTSTVAKDVKTGGLSTALVAALIAWCPLGVIATIAAVVAGSYDTLTIKVKMRYGEDDEYLYYQRYTYFYGDGNLIRIPENPVYDTGKEPLN
ncbi:hypothetical protein [Wukongibacter sp. M2B1]|uniref:hypothetical protein n=1 Tax=Wukongibacter sp. M2B1 TaxID=3088895 RepID=UPI003D7B01A4